MTARMLAENGWHVALIDINAAGLPGVEKELQDAGHSGLLSVPTNIASESSVADAYEQIDSSFLRSSAWSIWPAFHARRGCTNAVCRNSSG